MKKRNLISSIFFALLMFFSVQIFNIQTFAHAESNNIITYTISVGSNGLDITEKNILKPDESIIFGTDYELLSNALNAIQEEVTNGTISEETEIVVILDLSDFEINEDLQIPFHKSKISGTLNLNSHSLMFSPTTSNSILTLNDITLNTTGTQPLLISGGSQSSTMNLFNCSFLSSQTNNSEFAINSNNTRSNVVFDGTLVYNTKFLLNYADFNKITIKETLNLSNQENSQISIPVPYTADNEIIIRDFELDVSNINLVATEDFYTTGAYTNSTLLIAETYIKTNFHTNGGTLSDSYTTTGLKYNSISEIAYPNSETLTKEHCSLQGFLGTITIDDTTYYFDQTAISNFAQANFDKSKINDYFFTEISDSANYSYFSSYKYDANNTDPNFLAIKYFIENKESANFIACWEDAVYSLTFNSNEGSQIETISAHYGESITLQEPIKTGYTFHGWFDENLETEYSFTTMPDENLTLYAKWTLNKYTLSIHLNNGTSQIDVTTDYNSSLENIAELFETTYTNPGYSFDKWYTDANLTTELDLTIMPTMPANDINIYAGWVVETYTVYMYYNNDFNKSTFHTQSFKYNDDISGLSLKKPTVTGYRFVGWYTDENGKFGYSFNKMPSSDVKLYAYWEKLNYTLTFYNGTSVISSTQNLHVGESITAPDAPEITGYIFNGWFIDKEFTQEFTYLTMPARNLDVYAEMIEKLAIVINADNQTYEKSKSNGFNLRANTVGFNIEYLVDGKWTSEVPTAIGTYDIKITRAEDDNYKSFETIISDGLTITADKVDIVWLIVLLYSLFLVEMIVVLIVMVMRKRKISLTSLSIALPFGLFETSQFINFIIAFVLALFGFVLLVVELVKLHRINILDDTRTEREIQEELNEKFKSTDVSTNESIEKNVDKLLKQEGFIDEE